MNTYSIKERNIFLSIFLTFITCGIYGIYWFFSTVNDIYKLDEATDNLTLDVILYLLTGSLYGFFILYKVSKKLVSIKTKLALDSTSNTAVLIILKIFILDILNTCILQDELNNLKRYIDKENTPSTAQSSSNKQLSLESSNITTETLEVSDTASEETTDVATEKSTSTNIDNGFVMPSDIQDDISSSKISDDDDEL